MIKLEVSLVIFAILAIGALFGVLRALKKTLSVAICSLTLTVIAVPIAVLLTALISGASAGIIVNLLGGVLPDDLLSSGLSGAIRVFCATGIASVLLLILFPTINALLRISVKPLSRLLDKKVLHSDADVPATENTEAEAAESENSDEMSVKSEKTAETPAKSGESVVHKTVKLILGGVCGLVFAIAMLSPVVGLLKVAGNVASLPAALADEDSFEAKVFGTIADAGDAPAVKAVWYIGGAPVYKSISTYSTGSVRMSVTKEVSLFGDLADYLKNTSSNKGTFSSYSSAPKDSVLVGDILPDAFLTLFTHWESGESYAGIAAPSKDGMSGEILDGGLYEFSKLNRQQMKDSMIALVDLAAYVLDNGGIGDTEALFTDEDHLTEIYVCMMGSEVLHDVLRSALDAGLQNMTSKWSGVGIVLSDTVPTDADDIRSEAEALAHSTVSLIHFNNNYSLEGDSLEETLYNLGAILDGFKDTDMIGEEQTRELMESALRSESIKNALGYDTARAEKEIDNVIARLETESYADLLGELAEQTKR